MTAEFVFTILGMVLYLTGTISSAVFEVQSERRYGMTMGLIVAALIIHGIGIGLRWQRLDHGPYVNLYEILSSNIHSLHTAVLLGVLVAPFLRPLLAALLPLLSVMVLWFLILPPADSTLPVTYITIWLPIHIWLGKIFMGVMIIAVGGSVVILLRWWRGEAAFPMLPRSDIIDDMNGRLVLLAFTFECAMLVAGAVWAQDAWGRFWSWDPLETWSFITWVGVASFLHLRLVVRMPQPASAIILILLFALAYYTFFGVPFVSVNAHKGIF